MGQGYIRNDVGNDIANNNVVDADDLDGEFDSLVAAFAAATGHAHDGTAAEGGSITVVGPAQEYVSDALAFFPKTDNIYDLGKVTAEWKDLYIDGTAFLDSSIIDALTVVTSATFIGATIANLGSVTTADINGGTVDNTVIGATIPLAGSFTALSATGNITVGGTVDGRDLATDGAKLDGIEPLADVTDTVNVTAAGALMDSELTNIIAIKALNQGVATTDTPTFAGILTLGTVDGRDLSVDGAKLDGIEALADVTDTINVTAAGALMDSELANIAAIKALNQGVATTDSPTFATITATAVNATTFDMTNLEVTNIKAKDGTASGSIANVTGVLTVASSVLTTTDINGGTIDGTTIGGTTPAAATVTGLTATGGGSLTGTWTSLGTVTTMDLNGGTIDGTVIGSVGTAAGSFTTLNASGVLTADLSTISSTGDLAVADGGTGASTALAARTNLDVDQAGTALALAIALG